MFDGEAFGAEIVEAVKAYVEEATAPLLARLAELERRPTAEVVAEQIAHAVRAAVEAAPKPQDGRDGRDGVDGRDGARGEAGQDGRDGANAPPVSDTAIAEAVARHLEANPPPAGKDGRDGADGRDGERGERGEPGLAARIEPDAFAGAVALWLEANPPAAGRDGRDGVDGKDGAPGRNGADGAKGEKGDPGRDGADGVGLAGAVIDRAGELVITLSNGEAKRLGPVVGRDGKDGEPGPQGFGIDQFDIEQPDLRTMVVSFTHGDTKESYELALGGFVDRGGYKDGERYELGDVATWGGHLWLCQNPTSEKPGGNDDWRLAVRKGRDGKDADPSEIRRLVAEAVDALPKPKAAK
ncbi:MAG: hypothetical protein KIS90_03975 [Phenylobacterium sp.]|nr:hypothetical protein [Phenylobacterium sp.]